MATLSAALSLVPWALLAKIAIAIIGVLAG